MPEDKRQYLRLPVQNKVFVELVSPVAGSAESGEVAICKSIDLSRGGLRVSIEQELLVGAILQIGVELPESQDTLYLAGEVRWCLPDPEHDRTWWVGFELLNAQGSDINRWEQLLRSMNS